MADEAGLRSALLDEPQPAVPQHLAALEAEVAGSDAPADVEERLVLEESMYAVVPRAHREMVDALARAGARIGRSLG